MWINNIKNAIHRNFRKIHVKNFSIDNDIQHLLRQRLEIKENKDNSMNTKQDDEEKLSKIENEIKDILSDKKAKKIKEHLTELGENGSLNRVNMWNIKKALAKTLRILLLRSIIRREN